jgi:hypothetical protein
MIVRCWAGRGGDKGRPRRRPSSGQLQVAGGGLALLAALEFVLQLLAFLRVADPSALDSEMWTKTSFEPSSGWMKP